MYVKLLYLFLNQYFFVFRVSKIQIKFYRCAMYAKNYSPPFSDTALGAVNKVPLRIVQYLLR